MIPLFVPGDRPERFTKAAAAADVAILDLEDAVAADRKAVARDAVAAALQSSGDYWIRINPVESEAGQADLLMLANAPPPAAVLIAKASSSNDLRHLAAGLPNVRLYALIETIEGIVNLDAVANVPGLCGLAFGAYDLCAELGARVTAEVLAPWRAQIVLTARRYGLDALDTPYANLADEAGLADDARRAADFGFAGKLAIHPRQVPILRTAFRPSAAEIARAHAIVDQYTSGVAVVDGTMIDAPLLASARQTLARAGKEFE